MRTVSMFSVGLLLGGLHSAQATPLYEQPPIASDRTGFTRTSHVGSDIGGYKSYDDFVLNSDASIGSVTWRGMYWDYVNLSNIASPNTTTWTIQFFPDAGGGPGAPSYTISVPAAAVSANFIGYVPFQTSTVPLYDFSLTLPTSFNAVAGTTYWFSVLSHSATFDPLFSWTQGTGGNESAVQVILNPDGSLAGAPYTVPDDRAFSLTAVPEPGSLVLMLGGIGVVGWMARRRRAW